MIMTTFVRARCCCCCPTVPSTSAKRGLEYIHTEYINWHLAGNSSLGINYLQTKAVALAYSQCPSLFLSHLLFASAELSMIFTRFERLKCLHGNSLLSSCVLALPARRMGVQSAGRQNVARHKCWALTWGNNNSKRRRQRRWHPVSLSLPPYLTHSLSFLTCVIQMFFCL